MRAVVKLNDCVWRPMTDSDGDARFVVDVRSNPRFAPMFFNAGVSADGHRAFINAPDRADEINWMIERDGQPAGVASIYHLDRANKKAECGRTIMLDPALFHQNFIVSAFIAFDVMKLNKLWIETLESNAIIARGVERLGMTREGLLRWHAVQDGKPVNVWHFGGTSADWDQIRADRFKTWGTPELISFEGWKADG